MRTLPLALLAFASAAALAAKPLVICADADPDGFDPAQSANDATHKASAAKLYNNLIEYLPGPFAFTPSLAEKWEVSPDGLAYTLHLRRGVKWQTTDWFKPTREFDADDVLWTLERQIDPNHPGAKAAPGGFPYANSGDWKNLFKSIEKLDAHTVRLTLSKPYAPLLERLAHPALAIVSAEYGRQLERAGTPGQVASQPVGTGPYLLKRFDKGAQARYEANPAYWRKKPAIDKLILATVPDPAVRAQKLLAGECQLADTIKPQDLPKFDGSERFATVPLRIQSSSQLFFNVTKKPFDDKRVRQALALSIDRAAIVKSVYDNRAEAAATPYSARSLWGVEATKAAAPDIARAKKLLAEAGYPNGFEAEMWVRPGGSGTNPNFRLTAELIQADWAKLGVKLNLVGVEWVELVKKARAGEAPSLLSGWSGALDPDGFYSNLASCDAARNGYNFAQWCNAQADAALDAGRVATSQAARAKRYVEVQKILADEAPFTTLAYPLPVVVFDRKLAGVEPTANDSFKVEQLRWR
ncbi:ABC transporter substrate-binding protein [Chitinimonas koreensis]|uniref:ABC transporter substrate-binding protein n=1 Tax=Chitinimonas koreensis TaxID=356302 RepID=UPI0003FDBB80|nr:ABC transporter substrate-binding protein [Chitinimonas koreensis]QNM95765.1 ABC transporter substrate-binding protein [Chitinimonas koreensis]